MVRVLLLYSDKYRLIWLLGSRIVTHLNPPLSVLSRWLKSFFKELFHFKNIRVVLQKSPEFWAHLNSILNASVLHLRFHIHLLDLFSCFITDTYTSWWTLQINESHANALKREVMRSNSPSFHIYFFSGIMCSLRAIAVIKNSAKK